MSSEGGAVPEPEADPSQPEVVSDSELDDLMDSKCELELRVEWTAPITQPEPLRYL